MTLVIVLATAVSTLAANADGLIFVSTPNSVATALNAITDEGPTNRYTVVLGAGVYTETSLVKVPAYVHLRGSGPSSTIIRSTRFDPFPTSNAATLEIDCDGVGFKTTECGGVSDVQIRNEAAGAGQSIGVYSSGDSRYATLDNVWVINEGSMSAGHHAVFLHESEMTIRDSLLRAMGNADIDAALVVRSVAGPYPNPRIEGSVLEAGNGSNADNICGGTSGKGVGIWAQKAAPFVVSTEVCGEETAVQALGGGTLRIRHSYLRVGSQGALVDLTEGSLLTIANSGVEYTSTAYKQAGSSNPVCVNSFNGFTWTSSRTSTCQ